MTPKPWQLAFKLFLPSWNFFNQFSCITRVDVRLFSESTSSAPDSGSESAWTELYPQHQTINVLRIVFNPQGNRELLEKSFFERAVTEISELSEEQANQFADRPTYSLLSRIVSSKLSAAKPAHHYHQFQYRIVVTDLIAHTEEVVLLSPKISKTPQPNKFSSQDVLAEQ